MRGSMFERYCLTLIMQGMFLWRRLTMVFCVVLNISLLRNAYYPAPEAAASRWLEDERMWVEQRSEAVLEIGGQGGWGWGDRLLYETSRLNGLRLHGSQALQSVGIVRQL